MQWALYTDSDCHEMELGGLGSGWIISGLHGDITM
jgi:hypothetical protein